MSNAGREPIFNVPTVISWLIGVFVVVHLGRSLLDTQTDAFLVLLLSFDPARFASDGPDFPGNPWAGPLSFFSHAFLHGDIMHLTVNSAWLLAVGAPVARRMPAWSFLAYFALCAAGGALFFLIVHPGVDAHLIGASGAISGMMAAVFRLMYAAQDDRERLVLRAEPALAPRLSVGSTLTRRAPLTAVLIWVGLNVVFALAMGAVGDGAPIAWEAHLGGFFVGLFTLELFDYGNPEERLGSPDA